jgi:hypothetical protein
MSRTVLRFDLLGHGHCLFTEAIDLSALGTLEMTRASRIEFNQHTQQWEVRSVHGELLFRHRSRQACLQWEQQFFNRQCHE